MKTADGRFEQKKPAGFKERARTASGGSVVLYLDPRRDSTQHYIAVANVHANPRNRMFTEFNQITIRKDYKVQCYIKRILGNRITPFWV